jgi:hypothetical protein
VVVWGVLTGGGPDVLCGAWGCFWVPGLQVPLYTTARLVPQCNVWTYHLRAIKYFDQNLD